MKKLIAKCAAGALVLTGCGCVSVVGRATGNTWGSPYAGTYLALTCAGVEPILLADVPFDAVLDTALLPVDAAIGLLNLTTNP